MDQPGITRTVIHPGRSGTAICGVLHSENAPTSSLCAAIYLLSVLRHPYLEVVSLQALKS
jgi:hypothetical protein